MAGAIAGVADIRGRIVPGYATIDSDDKIPFWRAVGESVHEHDCKFFLQLSHSGRQRDIPGIEYARGLSSTDKPEPLRQVILRGLKLADDGGQHAVTLLEKWTGQTLSVAADKPTAALAAWQRWFSETYPNEPAPTLPADNGANDHVGDWRGVVPEALHLLLRDHLRYDKSHDDGDAESCQLEWAEPELKWVMDNRFGGERQLDHALSPGSGRVA